MTSMTRHEHSQPTARPPQQDRVTPDPRVPDRAALRRRSATASPTGRDRQRAAATLQDDVDALVAAGARERSCSSATAARRQLHGRRRRPRHAAPRSSQRPLPDREPDARRTSPRSSCSSSPKGSSARATPSSAGCPVSSRTATRSRFACSSTTRAACTTTRRIPRSSSPTWPADLGYYWSPRRLVQARRLAPALFAPGPPIARRTPAPTTSSPA